MENNEVRLKKVPIEVLLNALSELYAMGVEYVDIVGENGKEQDRIGLMYTQEYLSKDMQDKIEDIIDDIIDEQFKDDKLSDDDINQII